MLPWASPASPSSPGVIGASPDGGVTYFLPLRCFGLLMAEIADAPDRGRGAVRGERDP